jgi:hypothetical protein
MAPRRLKLLRPRRRRPKAEQPATWRQRQGADLERPEREVASTIGALPDSAQARRQGRSRAITWGSCGCAGGWSPSCCWRASRRRSRDASRRRDREWILRDCKPLGGLVMAVDPYVEGGVPEAPDAIRRAIESVCVRGLHGKFEYDLDIGPNDTESEAPIAVSSVTEDRLTLLFVSCHLGTVAANCADANERRAIGGGTLRRCARPTRHEPDLSFSRTRGRLQETRWTQMKRSALGRFALRDLRGKGGP